MNTEKITNLVSKAQNGDNAAMNDLFNACYNDIYFFALKTVKNEDLACDITQDTFVEIIKSINTLKDPSVFMSWAKRIAYFQCTRFFNKKTEMLVEEDEDGNSVFDTIKEDNEEFIPDEALDQKEFKEAILGIINTLSEEQRSAVILYYFDELSIKEIAEIQNVSVGTIKSRLNYARKTIKEGVEDYEEKNNVKLHAIPFFPFFRWLFKEDSSKTMPIPFATKVAAGITTASGVAITVANSGATVAGATVAGASVAGATVAGASVAGASASGSSAAKVGAAGGLLAKIAALPLAVKLLCGALIVTLVLGAVVAINMLNSNDNTSDTSSQTVSSVDSEEESSDEVSVEVSDEVSDDVSDEVSDETSVEVLACEHLNTHLVNEKATSCAAAGYTGDTVCDDCEVIVTKGEEIPAEEHKWEYQWKVVSAPSLSNSGERIKECRNCEAVLSETNTEVIVETIAQQMLGHRILYSGKNTYKADLCGNELVEFAADFVEPIEKLSELDAVYSTSDIEKALLEFFGITSFDWSSVTTQVLGLYRIQYDAANDRVTLLFSGGAGGNYWETTGCTRNADNTFAVTCQYMGINMDGDGESYLMGKGVMTFKLTENGIDFVSYINN